MAKKNAKKEIKALQTGQLDEEDNKTVEIDNAKKAETEAIQKMKEENELMQQDIQEKIVKAKALEAELAAKEAANKVPENYNDQLAFYLDKLGSKAWATNMDQEIGTENLYPEVEEGKKNLDDIPITRTNIFGAVDIQSFFNKFKFKIERNLMLDNKDGDISFENIKKLVRLLVGTFKIEARELYSQIEQIIQNKVELFDGYGNLKKGLPYSETALTYYIVNKNQGEISLEKIKSQLNTQVMMIKARIENHLSEGVKFYDREQWSKWQFIAQEVVKIYSDPQFQWWKNRVQEVQWSRGDIPNSERAQLWSTIMESITAIGNKRIFDDDGKIRKSRWYFDMESDDDSEEEKGSDDDDDEKNPAPKQLYSNLNMTKDQVNFLKEILSKKQNEERSFKIKGVLTSSVITNDSFEDIALSGLEKVVLKIHMDQTGLEDPDKWETCMLLNEKIAKKSNNCLFLNAMMTVEQHFYNDKKGYHIFDVHQHTEK